MAETVKEKSGLNKYVIEIVTYAFFVIFSIVMFVFHELWYDEIQAYMLAMDASWHDLIFDVTHYEGHPPLFSLLLALFAKNGVYIDVGLRIVSFFFSLIGAFLVIFKAPFKKWIRCLIPFTYFIFYQYTVICRPYAMMFAAFMLVACFYKSRNTKPFRYILSLYLLCMCSSYGLLFAGCFCVVWTVEIIIETKGKGFWKRIIIDKRFWSLWAILLGALAIIYLIMPGENAFASNFYNKTEPLNCLIYTLFMLPADAMVTDVGFFGSLQNNAYQFTNLSMVSLSAYLVTILILVTVYFVTYTHKKRRMFFLPYFAFCGFAALGYMCNHHIGITVLYFVFLMWISFDDKERRELPKWIASLDEKYNKLPIKFAWLVLILCMGMSLMWTCVSCFNDIRYEAWYAKSLNKIFEDYNLTDYRIIADWSYLPIVDGEIVYAYGDSQDILDEAQDEIDEKDGLDNEDGFFYEVYQMYPEDYYQFPTLTNFADIIAYNSEGKNYICNFNDGRDDKRYIEHNCYTREEANDYCIELGKLGYPDIIMGDPNIMGLMGLDMYEDEYLPIYEIKIFRPYKYFLNYQRSYVYIRSDLFWTRSTWPYIEQYKGYIN